jgi:hypothetical protein
MGIRWRVSWTCVRYLTIEVESRGKELEVLSMKSIGDEQVDGCGSGRWLSGESIHATSLLLSPGTPDSNLGSLLLTSID